MEVDHQLSAQAFNIPASLLNFCTRFAWQILRDQS
jgi:hypothetical protein